MKIDVKMKIEMMMDMEIKIKTHMEIKIKTLLLIKLVLLKLFLLLLNLLFMLLLLLRCEQGGTICPYPSPLSSLSPSSSMYHLHRYI